MKALLLFCLLFFVAWDLGWLAAGVVQTLPWRLRSMRAGALKPQLLDVRTPAEYARSAPCYGRDNAHVLRDILGLDAATIEALEAAGILT